MGAEHGIVLLEWPDLGLVVKMEFRCHDVTAGNGAKCSILLPLEVFTAAITEGMCPDGRCIVDDAATNCLVGFQEHILAALPACLCQFLEDVVALSYIGLGCLTLDWVLFEWCEKFRMPLNVIPSTFMVRQVGRAAPATEMFSGVFSCLLNVVNNVADEFPLLRMRLHCLSQVASWTR